MLTHLLQASGVVTEVLLSSSSAAEQAESPISDAQASAAVPDLPPSSSSAAEPAQSPISDAQVRLPRLCITIRVHKISWPIDIFGHWSQEVINIDEAAGGETSPTTGGTGTGTGGTR